MRRSTAVPLLHVLDIEPRQRSGDRVDDPRAGRLAPGRNSVQRQVGRAALRRARSNRRTSAGWTVTCAMRSAATSSSSGLIHGWLRIGVDPRLRQQRGPAPGTRT